MGVNPFGGIVLPQLFVVNGQFSKMEFLSQNERDEFADLVVIVQQLSGVDRIANSSKVMHDPMCKSFTDRIRHLIVKNMDLEEKASVGLKG